MRTGFLAGAAPLRGTAFFAVADLPAGVSFFAAVEAFFAGGCAIALALSRYAHRVNGIYAADLIGAAAGCLLLIPIVNMLGAPGGVLFASAIGAIAALCFATPREPSG